MATASTLTFFVPSSGDDHAHRADSRVRRLDHDEVTGTTRVEFPDGFRLVVRDVDLVTRRL